MSLKKHIRIIGGGLCGCLTAYHIAVRYPGYYVELVETSDHLISAFDPISLDGHALNNGFHGIELPRADAFYSFIIDELELDFTQKVNSRLLFIKNNLVPFVAPLSEWPIDLQKEFLVKPPFESNSIEDFWSVLSEEYKGLLKVIGARYSHNVQDILGLLIPWFLPADYVLNSGDEGDLFRNNVRNNSILPMYGHPTGHVFDVLQDAMLAKLETLGVKIHLSTSVVFNADGFEFCSLGNVENSLKVEADYTFFCASSSIIIKEIDSTIYNKLTEKPRYLYNGLLEVTNPVETTPFSEIICADAVCPAIARISAPDEFGYSIDHKGKYLQVELFIQPSEDVNKLRAELPSHISRILGLRQPNTIKLLEMKLTRFVFQPKKEDLALAEVAIASWVRNQATNLAIQYNFGPINMAKAWKKSSEFAESVQ